MLEGINSAVGSYFTAENITTGKKKEDIKSFDEILQDKASKNLSAKDYLLSLSSEELYTIQQAHRMTTIHVNNLSEEGAQNLLVAIGDKRKYVDLNNDGVTEIGEARTFIFPPPNAPDEVKDAWEKTTANMTFKQKMLAEIPFFGRQAAASFKIKADGTYEHVLGYRNIFDKTIESYVNLVNDIKAELEERLKKDPYSFGEDQRKNIRFQLGAMETFLSNLVQ